MEGLLNGLIWGGASAVVVGLAVWARRRRLRPAPKAPAPQQLAEECVARVREAFGERIPLVDAECHRGRTDHDPVYTNVWFIVAEEAMEERLRGSAALAELEQAVRAELGRSGYIRQTGAVVSVGIASRERLDRDGWQSYYE